MRDRTRGLVDLDAKIGFDTIFNKEEEQTLADHITYMAETGHAYNKTSVKLIAKDYADTLGKSVKAKKGLSNNWLYQFIKRWPNLKFAKQQKPSAKSASRLPSILPMSKLKK